MSDLVYNSAPGGSRVLLSIADLNTCTSADRYGDFWGGGKTGRWMGCDALEPQNYDKGSGGPLSPHFILTMHTTAEARPEITQGELVCVLRSITGRISEPKARFHMVHPVLLISVFAGGLVRILQAYLVPGKDLVDIHHGNTISLADGNDESMDTVLRWIACRSGGNTLVTQVKSPLSSPFQTIPNYNITPRRTTEEVDDASSSDNETSEESA
ncbi:hypothetical protein MMC25_007989 [Agyrium rufum]|nr:hypothetical protein [Agyrium rufum]